MHEVLDEAATDEETALLRAHLADDEDAAAEFASWKGMFDGLARMPKSHPPEGLVASIVASMPTAVVAPRTSDDEFFVGSHQLFQAAPVLRSGTARTTRTSLGFKTISSWLVPASSRESYMNTQKKVLAVGTAAVVAVGVAVVLLGFPPKSTDVIGTVVPAERYRAPQTGSEGVKLGDQAGGSSAPVAGSTDTAAAVQQNAASQSLASQNLANQNLANQNLANQNLANQNLANQNLANQNLANQNLANQNLTNQNLANQNMANQNLANQNLANQNLANQNLANQNLANQNLTNQNLTNQNLANQNMANQNLANQNLANQNHANQNLANQNMANQNLANQNMANQNNRDYK